MQSVGVLFVRDPVIALDLAEILASQLGSIQLMTPQFAEQANDMLDSAAFVVTDHKGLRDLEVLRASWPAPTLFLGSELPEHSQAQVTRISNPFTNKSVSKALNAVGLIPSMQPKAALKRC